MVWLYNQIDGQQNLLLMNVTRLGHSITNDDQQLQQIVIKSTENANENNK